MMKAVDIKGELAGRPVLHGRGPDTPDAQAETAFAILAPFRDGSIFAGSFAGDSPWERHRNGDELVQILDGAATLTVMTDDGSHSFEMRSGMMIVVPQGHWHRFHAPEPVTVLTATPQPTDQTFATDPRTGGRATGPSSAIGGALVGTWDLESRQERTADGVVHPASNLGKSLAGVLLMATAVGHALVGVVLFREPLTAIFEEGVVNTIHPPLYAEHPHFDRIATFWFFIFSVVLLLLGQITNRAVAQRDRDTVRLVGWYLLGMGAIGGLVLPISGQWILIALAAVVFKAASAADQPSIRAA